jgi:hypothetical protein
MELTFAMERDFVRPCSKLLDWWRFYEYRLGLRTVAVHQNLRMRLESYSLSMSFCLETILKPASWLVLALDSGYSTQQWGRQD